MLVGVLSDIHANLPALNAVIKELPSKVNELWVLGDITGYYYQTKEVLDLLKSYSKRVILGNHEVFLRDAYFSEETRKMYKKKYGSSLEFALATLSKEEINWLTNLPLTIEINEFEKKIFLSHGSPWDLDEYIYPDSPPEKLEKFKNYSADIFFVGHSHYPMDKIVSGKRIINPGSVGQPRNRISDAQWVLFDTDNYSAQFMRTPYEKSELIADALKYDFDLKYLREVLTRS